MRAIARDTRIKIVNLALVFFHPLSLPKEAISEIVAPVGGRIRFPLFWKISLRYTRDYSSTMSRAIVSLPTLLLIGQLIDMQNWPLARACNKCGRNFWNRFRADVMSDLHYITRRRTEWNDRVALRSASISLQKNTRHSLHRRVLCARARVCFALTNCLTEEKISNTPIAIA